MRDLRVVAFAVLSASWFSGCGGANSSSSGLQPMPAAAPGVAVEPATFTHLADSVDLRKIPVPDDARLQSRELGMFFIVLSRNKDAAVEFVREQMTKLGCKEVQSETPSTPPFVSLAFAGGGCLVTAFISPDETQANATNLVINSVGNIDARSLPQPEGATPLASFWTSQNMTTNDDLDHAVAAARDVLHKAGWRDVVHTGTPDQSSSGDQRFFNVFKNGINVSVFVSKTAAQPEQTDATGTATGAGKTSIQYNCTLIGAELPLPPDATDVEFAREPGKLTCRSATPLAEVAEFYRDRFEKLGWKKWKNRGVVREKHAALFYVHGNDVSFIELAADDKGTRITAQGLPEEISADEKRAYERGKQAQEDKTSNLVELPLPDDAREIQYDEDARKVTFQSTKSIGDLVSFYQKAFADDGWKEREENRSVLETTGNYNAFKANDDFVFVNLFRQNAEKPTEVTALAIGCRWNKKPGDQETKPAEAEAPTAEKP